MLAAQNMWNSFHYMQSLIAYGFKVLYYQKNCIISNHIFYICKTFKHLNIMKKHFLISVCSFAFFVLSCQKENIRNLVSTNQSSKQDQIEKELSNIRDMKFVEVPLEQIVETK
jgi:hypothetical protein